jgi:hypothetical protein
MWLFDIKHALMLYYLTMCLTAQHAIEKYMTLWHQTCFNVVLSYYVFNSSTCNREECDSLTLDMF